jgi:glycosyltransferase involved in cell wall biosynthesis
MKLAIVHDYLNQMGGAERVLLVLHELYPDAPIYTSIYAPDRVDPAFRRMDIRASFMQRLPLVHTHHQAFLPLFPFAFESLDLRAYDVVLSMSSGWAKNVLTRPETCHICYCLTPMRFGWNFNEYVAREPVAGWQRAALMPIMTALRLWDVAGANRVDYFAAISTVVARRIRKFYRREATVIYPPVDTSRYAYGAADAAEQPNGRVGDGYVLVVSRLVPYKRVDLAIEACNRLKLPLKILGDGRDRPRLERMAGPTVEFLGFVDEATKRRYLHGCRAFIFPGEEDFGIAPLEAMAAGRPVVAYAAGGALDTVIDGQTGVLFAEPSAEALAAALERALACSWDRTAVAAHAARFSVETFKTQLSGFVAAKVAEFRAGAGSARLDRLASPPAHAGAAL